LIVKTLETLNKSNGKSITVITITVHNNKLISRTGITIVGKSDRRMYCQWKQQIIHHLGQQIVRCIASKNDLLVQTEATSSKLTMFVNMKIYKLLQQKCNIKD